MISLIKVLAEIVLNIMVSMGLKKAREKEIQDAIKEAIKEQSDSVAEAGGLRQGQLDARERLKQRGGNIDGVVWNFDRTPINFSELEEDEEMVEKEAKKFTIKYVDGVLLILGDLNQDGEPSFKITVNSPEVLNELINIVSGKPFELKNISFSFEGGTVVIKGDLNKNGVPCFVVEIFSLEVFDEIFSLVKGKIF